MELFDYEKEHIGLLRDSLAECTLFLRQNGAFPLEAPGRIAAYGNGVRHTVKGGTGSGEVNSRYSVNVEQGLKDAGFTITTGRWLDAFDQVEQDAQKAFVKEIKERAKKKHTMAILEGMGAVMPQPEYDLPLDGEGDTAIYVLSRISGEGNDREPIPGDIRLTDSEAKTILALDAKYEKFMLVLNVGGVVDLTPVKEVSNILVLSQLGVETGSVLADILLGRANPSGKLTTTWASWEDYCREGEFGDINDTRYKEGIYVGYRYFDTVGKKPLFPFGYGLSYTSFDIAVTGAAAEGDTIRIKVAVSNTGARAGREVVQVYVSAPAGRLDKPYQDLAAFSKTDLLEPGASQELTISFSLRDCASYDAQKESYVLEAGSYVVRVGDSSDHTQPAALVDLDGEAVVTKAGNCLGETDFEDWKPSGSETAAAEELSDITRISVAAADIETVTVSYDQEREIDPRVKDLTVEELAYLNVGAFNPKAGALSVIGNAATNVAGAAGETTGILKEKGFPVLVMSDGPAGLRLAKEFYRDEKGAHGIGSSMVPESFLPFLPAPARFIMNLIGGSGKPKKGQKVEYQYATAIPIGTAIAQSFNLPLAESYGSIVGDEMERFGVHLWLAPALNIHRDIRCGRNFEYYSEDPLISGKTAAAITRGVQRHPGCGTTIKHYAANNQEKNRYCNNSIVSERAMREIYLKGFGICVRESQPHALMTSYNLLNGVHTSEHRGLIEDILRCEYGFKGIVMTDWIVDMAQDKQSLHRMPIAAEIAKAGGDLVMPGSKGDFDSIVKAAKSGELELRQLQINATRVLRKAEELHI
ncbi:MAG TPA: glycoside hydrolase family 3 C-terminal domain-containing protein [Candidatus Pullilachnospira gallistercoris]|uniref:Glycoside hydrolase family 3 C-terminal domain-containing protein n=1 Tax=Candidatus Pullilachnospira gallistercoris TaxID=2840911 RepID=A0A9D1E8F0_9FIRM|nr:glycoside hydrolase family 3 C-terminal domain-containing protein [Candidatus Pullilachnospira gallistercoris]